MAKGQNSKMAKRQNDKMRTVVVIQVPASKVTMLGNLAGLPTITRAFPTVKLLTGQYRRVESPTWVPMPRFQIHLL